MHRGTLLKVWAAFGPHVSEEQRILRSLFSFHLFPSKGKRGAYPFCFLTTSSLKFLAYYAALTYQKQDAFLYCQPFHLKCKLILTQCALTKIKVGTLTFPGPHPPLRPPWSLSLAEQGGAKRGRGEEGRGRRLGIVSPGAEGCPHLALGASQSPAHLVLMWPIETWFWCEAGRPDGLRAAAGLRVVTEV